MSPAYQLTSGPIRPPQSSLPIRPPAPWRLRARCVLLHRPGPGTSSAQPAALRVTTMRSLHSSGMGMQGLLPPFACGGNSPEGTGRCQARTAAVSQDSFLWRHHRALGLELVGSAFRSSLYCCLTNFLPGWHRSVVEHRPLNQEVTARFPVGARGWFMDSVPSRCCAGGS